MSTPILPFVWTNSVSIINGHMISLDIRNYSTQTELEIVNLTELVDLRIRNGSDPPKTSKGKVEYSKTLEHSFIVTHNQSTINIEVDGLRNFKNEEKGDGQLWMDTKTIRCESFPNSFLIKGKTSVITPMR